MMIGFTVRLLSVVSAPSVDHSTNFLTASNPEREMVDARWSGCGGNRHADQARFPALVPVEVIPAERSFAGYLNGIRRYFLCPREIGAASVIPHGHRQCQGVMTILPTGGR